MRLRAILYTVAIRTLFLYPKFIRIWTKSLIKIKNEQNLNMQNPASPLQRVDGYWEHHSLRFMPKHDWEVMIQNDVINVVFNGKTFDVSPEKINLISGLLSSVVELEDDNQNKYQLRGWKRDQIKEFQQALEGSLLHFYYRYPEKVFLGYQSWRDSFTKEYEKEKSRGWVWIDPVTPYSAPQPPGLKDSDWINHAKPLFNRLDPETDFELVLNIRGYIYKENRKDLELLIKEDSGFFDTIEKNPLTEEQRRAVACFAPRTLVVAAAGSGKSSVLAAKTAYAIKKGFFLPSEMLLLAFNNDAAAGLKNKVTSATGKDIEVCTFHKFCLQVIGKATGRKPAVAKFIEQEQGDRVMGNILLDLIKDPLYKHKFDSYNLFFGPRHKEAKGEEEKRGFQLVTKQKEIVKEALQNT